MTSMTPLPDAPIAIVGLACRFPQADDPDEYWELLRDGTDAVTVIPSSRPDLIPPTGRADSFRGGFLSQVDQFDADLFGVSPREATTMDPQQRLVLELGWESLESARIAATTLRGTAAGVFIGVAGDDYAKLGQRYGPASITPHSMTGMHRSIVANRVSYLLGLRGPSLTVDTGQSSSLVAVHLAAASLRRGECALALAGGVSLMLTPEAFALAAALGVLSPDGRCHTFDSRANGFVRGEGGGVVVLKPLAQAAADGDRIRAVILGSALNHNGGTESLTAPSRAAQEDVLRQAYDRAGIAPHWAQYVELHGTGTKAGDPVEAAALGTILGAGRPADAPLIVGSAKTNIGHLEGAAGVAGLIKAILSIEHRRLVPSLHFSRPNPAIALESLRLRVQCELGPWPRAEEPLLAGVSSFGMGGSNCHMVLSEAPPPTRVAPRSAHAPAGGRLQSWALSAPTAAALAAQAGRLRSFLTARPDLATADVGLSLAVTRSAFACRAVVSGADRAALTDGLAALERGQTPSPDVVAGQTIGTGPPVLVFPGQGSQWAGMSAGLCESSPSFRDRLEDCAAALAQFVDWNLTDVLAGADGAPGLDRVDVVQPVLWAVMVSLAELWRAAGVSPAAVVGHSQGEIAAATVAGALSLDDAARVVALRSQALTEIAGHGGMMSVALPAGDVQGWLGENETLTVAAVNSPGFTVVAGDLAALERLGARLDEAGHWHGVIPVSYASHSPQVERLRERILTDLAPVAPRPAVVPLVSTVTGQTVDTASMGAEYWYQNLRAQVQFDAAVRSLLGQGHRLFIEASPHPGLVASLHQIADAAGVAVSATGTLRRGDGGPDPFWRAAAEAYVRGAAVDWALRYPGALLVDLPTYAFQRQRYWLTGGAARTGDLSEPRASADAGALDGPVPGIRDRLAAMTTADRADAVMDLVRACVAVVLGHDAPDAVDPLRPFRDLGLDSVTAIELRNRIAAGTGLRLPVTLVFDHPTPADLARYVCDAVSGERAALTVSPEAQTAAGEPVAIVSMACRLPGAVSSPEGLWHLVATGGDAITPFPADRGWSIAGIYDPDPGKPGKSYVCAGGFIADAAGFDAGFFGVSPREAQAMDPQQRLLLETSWEAFERAGINPARLRGSDTGVFIGGTAADYGPRLGIAADEAEGFGLTGGAPSVLSGRLSFVFGFEGPALTVDTACSSSLVATHLAVQSLRRGECGLALAGGVSVMATPGMFVEFSRQRGLAPDGRCKPFAAAADGTAWAEGAGLLLLEPVSTARKLGHRVLAVILGSAVNQDGASNGLSAPNGRAQQRVITQALADARLNPADVDLVEAHGTGTMLGDPIEAQALLAVYGQNRDPQRPLWLGSVKSNLGHTQAAAGITGVIKMVEAMRHGVMPATLHVDEPTPHVQWSAGTLALLTEQRPWPVHDRRPRRAGVSSFGISGTNAHLILEQRLDDDPAGAAPEEPGLFPDALAPWVLSAADGPALATAATRLAEAVAAEPHWTAADVAAALARRPVQAHRAVVLATGRDDGAQRARELAAGGPAQRVVRGTAARRGGKTVFMFGGQGAQWLGMGRGLAAACPVFAARLNECEQALAPWVDWSLASVLSGDAEQTQWRRVDVVQPVLFAVMVSLAQVWMAAGLSPDAVVGHSQGELAAACVARGLTLEDAAKAVALRSKALRALAGQGAMVSVALPAEQVAQRLETFGEDLGVAAVNGRTATVVSGSCTAAARFAAVCEADNIPVKVLDVGYASHHAQVEQVRDLLVGELAGIRPRAGSGVTFYSTITGAATDMTTLDARYWYANLRQPVQFAAAARTLLADGYRVFVDASPHPVAAAAVQDSIDAAEADALVLETVRRSDDSPRRVLMSIAKAAVRGLPVDWHRVTGSGRADQRVDLPTYPFQRKRYWLEAPAGHEGRASRGGGGHPLLGDPVPLADEASRWFTRTLGARNPWFILQHRILGVPTLTAAALLEWAVAAALAASGAGPGCALADVKFSGLVRLPVSQPAAVQAVVDDAPGASRVRCFARPAGRPDQPWAVCLQAALDRRPPEPHSHRQRPEDLREGLAAASVPDVGQLYERLGEAGIDCGLALRGIRRLWRGADEAVALIEADHAERDGATYWIHPAVLDPCLRLGMALPGTGDDVRIPSALDRLLVYQRLTPKVWSHARRAGTAPGGEERLDITLLSESGEQVAVLQGLRLTPASYRAPAVLPSRPAVPNPDNERPPAMNHEEAR